MIPGEACIPVDATSLRVIEEISAMLHDPVHLGTTISLVAERLRCIVVVPSSYAYPTILASSCLSTLLENRPSVRRQK
jgi:hypothetical protein